MTEHDRELLEEWQRPVEDRTTKALLEMLTATIDDLRSRKGREAAHTFRVNREQLRAALRSLHDLWMDLEPVTEFNPIVRLSDLRELRRA